ncbi:multidrug effflux MFS transporter [Wenxinia marina]|uniref:Bcr/CflA family efflux transporter n=1 Tax=Wenxinia marina DSM 24838 TaxID=1123501 RepID=A0A0D0Q488_9RHOB|nr:multidrug effflux MFS transporter [Wenxinia marina]KIQ69344.1 drug resistance transporter, Bcr/CflA subfamily [Wenxinia marina DSM 24838]GGL57581.1 Bcr/CflA family drug resistance efflux transporter [Wenxinia marina]
MLRTALVLALLSAVGPFAIDLYLPALPAIAEGLGADVAAIQGTLTAYFLAFGVAQLVYGPLADQLGRKPPIYIGLAIFAVGSFAAAMAPTAGWLSAARFVQGLGGAAIMVVPRAIIRDMHTGAQATKMMAMVMLVISVSPMLAPLAGAGLLTLGDWRLIFWVLLAAALVCLVIAKVAQPETLPPERRVRVNLRSMGRGFRVLLTDRTFMGLTLIGGFGMASFFVFLASASFVYVEQFGLSPTGFSLAFAVNAVGFFGASQAAGPLGARFGMVPVMRLAVVGFAFFTSALFLLVLAGFGTLPVIIAMLFLGNACLGLVIPTTMVMALDPHGQIAGLASSLGGTLQMVAGGAMIVATGPFFDGTALPMVAAIAVCGLGALALSLLTLPRVVETAPAV